MRLLPVGERGRPQLVGPKVTLRANGDLFLNECAWVLLGEPKTVKLGVSYAKGTLEICVTHRGDREGFRAAPKGKGFLIRCGRAMALAGLLPRRGVRMEVSRSDSLWPTLVASLLGQGIGG